ncbi:MAG: hypothetical protein ACR2JY_02595 [Chloroflexota bacterium]
MVEPDLILHDGDLVIAAFPAGSPDPLGRLQALLGAGDDWAWA